MHGPPGGEELVESLGSGKFLFSLVISYTETCEIPGITAAGAAPELFQYTPPADAEFLHYGRCRSIDGIPMTPDGKPTPALLTKAALESASIPHVVIGAGSKVPPMMPYMETGLHWGGNITQGPAMARDDLLRAIDYGRIIGRTLSSLTDCLVIGESIPGGTTTALGVLRGLGRKARVSSSMPENPVELKEHVVENALRRGVSEDPFSVAASLGDPMIPVVAGMASGACGSSKVLLAGGTQMAAVLALGEKLGIGGGVAVATTSYVVDDESADLVESVGAAGVPVISVDPLLSKSKEPGLRAFSEGFAKEGAGAGGAITAAMLKTGTGPREFLPLAEDEYRRVLSAQ
ncbi:phosphoribosyltransferase [Cenarchaeum symbiosum A]|uniref:UPF0284 protein CENSYa_1601 n=1 Tax=Cenarchaeum symbiosum (strain A) TaxID=414004 RepID=A0RY04_CENSY|nr:phosphoribosyltransferase [Cenarchaeum symbiosum A]